MAFKLFPEQYIWIIIPRENIASRHRLYGAVVSYLQTLLIFTNFVPWFKTMRFKNHDI